MSDWCLESRAWPKRRTGRRLLCALAAVLLSGAGIAVGEDTTLRVLMIGDSHAFFPYFGQDPPALSAAFSNYGQGLEQWRENGSLALFQGCGESGDIYCATAQDWNESERLRSDIRDILLLLPEIDIIHMSLGINDFNGLGIGYVDDPAVFEQLYDEVEANVRELTEYCLSLRPDVRVVQMGYEYVNITEGFAVAEDGSLYDVLDNYASLYQGLIWYPETIFDVFDYQKQYNGYFVGVDRRRMKIAEELDRVAYVNTFGTLHAHFGIPSLGVAPTYPDGMPGGADDGYAPFPAGYPDWFSPKEAMNPGDPVHFSAESYVKLMDNAVEQVYANWLLDTEGPRCVSTAPLGVADTACGAREITFAVEFSEPVTGVSRNDFVVPDAPAGTWVRSVDGSGTSYVVTVRISSEAGTYRLDLVDDDTIYDAAWIPLGKTGLIHEAGDGDFGDGTEISVEAVSIKGVPEGGCEGEGGGEGEGESTYHAGDTNADGALDLSELLRVILFYNVDRFGCAVPANSTEDGYDPGGTTQDCPPHSADYLPAPDWRFSLSELLRVIQFFQIGGVDACAESEDGFCPAAR